MIEKENKLLLTENKNIRRDNKDIFDENQDMKTVINRLKRSSAVK